MAKGSKRTKTSQDVSSYEKQIYDLKQLLEISKSFSSVLEYKTVIESILYICMCQMRALTAALFIKTDFDSNSFTLESNYSGMELSPDVNYSISQSHPLIKLLENTNITYTYEELSDILRDELHGVEIIGTLSPSLIVPLIVKKHLNGILVLGERIDLGEGSVYSSYEKEQILNIASLAAIAINNSALMDMTTTDMMTHLKLKHYFFSILLETLDRSYLNKTPVSVLMLDIDFFKHFNDTYGHACGDMVLIEVASIIKSCVPTNDLAARYGGEEFVVMLGGSGKDEAFEVAEKIRKAIEAHDFEFEGEHMKVTISIGVAETAGEEQVSSQRLVEQADEALYLSKSNGRNRTSIYSLAGSAE